MSVLKLSSKDSMRWASLLEALPSGPNTIVLDTRYTGSSMVTAEEGEGEDEDEEDWEDDEDEDEDEEDEDFDDEDDDDDWEDDDEDEEDEELV